MAKATHPYENLSASQCATQPAPLFKWNVEEEIATGIPLSDLRRRLLLFFEGVLRPQNSGESTRDSDCFREQGEDSEDQEGTDRQERKRKIIAKVCVVEFDGRASQDTVEASFECARKDFVNEGDELQEEMNSLRYNMSQFEKFARKLESTIEKQQSEIISLRREVQCFKDKREEYRTKEDRLQTDVSTIKNKIMAIRDDLNETNHEKASIREKLNQLELLWHMDALSRETMAEH